MERPFRGGSILTVGHGLTNEEAPILRWARSTLGQSVYEIPTLGQDGQRHLCKRSPPSRRMHNG